MEKKTFMEQNPGMSHDGSLSIVGTNDKSTRIRGVNLMIGFQV